MKLKNKVFSLTTILTSLYSKVLGVSVENYPIINQADYGIPPYYSEPPANKKLFIILSIVIVFFTGIFVLIRKKLKKK